MRPRRGRPTGYSLLDLLVAILLGAMISYILFLFATGVGRHYFNITEKMTQIERAAFFERRISQELSMSSTAGITPSAAGPAGQTLAIQGFDAVVPPGRLRWGERVYLFRHLAEDKRLLAWPTSLAQMGISPSFSHPETLTVDSLPTLPALSDGKGFLQWENVTEFRVEKPEGTPAVRVISTFEEVGVRRNHHRYHSDRLYPVWNDFEP